MGWLKRSAAALFISAAALVGYNTTGTTQETTPTVVEERTYSKQRLTPDIVNDTRYKLANATAYALITLGAVGLGYAGKQSRRNGYRPAELDDADRGVDIPLIRPLKYDTLSAEDKTKVDAQLEEARKIEQAAGIRAEQARETARKLKEAEDILGGKEAVESLKNNTRITRQFSERTSKYDAPEYRVVVSSVTDDSVRQDYVAHGKSIESMLGRYVITDARKGTGQFVPGRFDISAEQLRQIIEPYANEIDSHDAKIKELKQKEAENRAELIRRQIRAASVKL